MVSKTQDAPHAAEGSLVTAVRRSQLVASAITLIADVGVERASVVRIAARAGLSRGLFAYHFSGVDDLHDAIVAHVYALGAEELEGKTASAGTPAEKLRTFVGGSVDFYASHTEEMTALREIFHARRRTRTSRDASTHHRGEITAVTAVLRAGQESGEFRAFDPQVMARLVRAALDTSLDLLADSDTGAVRADIDKIRAELVATVDAMTRSSTAHCSR